MTRKVLATGLALDDAQLNALCDLAIELDMDVLVEAHDADEVDRALRTKAQVIGINSMGIEKQDGQGLGFAIAVDHAKQLLAGESMPPSSTTPLAGLNQVLGGQRAPN